MAIPKYPILFYKPATALTGPFDPIPIPLIAQEGSGLDYECELVVVIGSRARDVPTSKALEHVLGYAVGNDLSHRDWQTKRGSGTCAHHFNRYPPPYHAFRVFHSQLYARPPFDSLGN